MKLTDYPDWVQHALAVYEFFRRLGFSRDDIYFRFMNVIQIGGPAFSVTIEKPKDTILFSYIITPVNKKDEPLFMELFSQASEAWNTPANREECGKLFEAQRSTNLREATALVAKMVFKGLLEKDGASWKAKALT